MDRYTRQCAPIPQPPPVPPPTPMQVAQQQQSDTITGERNACVHAVDLQQLIKTEGQVAGYAIWRSKLKRCDDLWMSRLAAQRLKSMGGNCSLKLDWMLRYQMMLYDPDQKAMAEDRYAEFCGQK